MTDGFFRTPSRANSWAALAVLLAYLVLVKLLITIWPAAFRSTAQAEVFAWPMLAVVGACAAIGVALLGRTGFPGGWDEGVTHTWRLWIPLAGGVALGLAAIVTDARTHWAAFVADKMHIPSIHIGWPASLAIYPGGAIIVEVFYRLLPIPLLLWLASFFVPAGRGRSAVFWTLAVATSLIEPYGDLDLLQIGAGTMLAVFAQDFALNLWQAYLFRRAGFVASILTRVAFYAVWHIA